MHTTPTGSWLITLNRANGVAEAAAAVAVHAGIARIEVQVPRAERVARAERRRPVVAERTLIVEARIEPAAGGRQENVYAMV